MSGQDPYIYLSEAGRLSGYTAEYLRQLCIAGKLEGHKLGKNWVTTAAAVERFKQGQLPLPPTLAEIAGTSVVSYSKAQMLLAATVALIVFFPVVAQLVRLPDRVNYLSAHTNALVAATQDSINHKLQHYLAHLLGLDNGVVAGASISQISYPYNFIGPHLPGTDQSTAVKVIPAPAISNSALVSALRSLLAVGLPDDVKLALQGPIGVAGPAGPAGAVGPAGPAGYSGISFTVPGALSPGSIGSVTFGSADQFVARTITANGDINQTPGTANLNNLTVAGTSSITGDETITGNSTISGNLTLTGSLLTGSGPLTLGSGIVNFSAVNPVLDTTGLTSTLNINTTTNRPVTFGSGAVTVPNLVVTNTQTSAGTMSILSNAMTQTIFTVTGAVRAE